MSYDNNFVVNKTSLADISLSENTVKFKNNETVDDRIKRQKHEFFTLLTTQLKNQDPLSPMDTNEMTAQMFAINQVEQQLETNRLLSDIKNYLSVNQNSAYLNYIGKVIDFAGNEVVVDSDMGIFTYDIQEGASEASIKIRDDLGNIVHTELVDYTMGNHNFNWYKPNHLPNGVYSYSIEATKLNELDDTPVRVKLYSSGRVDSIINKDGQHYFNVNNKLIPTSEYTKIKDDSLYTSNMLSDIKAQIDKIDSRSMNNEVIPKQKPTTLPIPSLDDPEILEEIKRKLFE